MNNFIFNFKFHLSITSMQGRGRLLCNNSYVLASAYYGFNVFFYEFLKVKTYVIDLKKFLIN